MDVQRSKVPGYDATVVQLGHNERFVLRNPNDPGAVIAVRTVVAFDHGAPHEPDRPYFRVWGSDLGGDPAQVQELHHNFTDFGELPPHVRDTLGHEPRDHARGRAPGNTWQQSHGSPGGRRAPLDDDTVARLRAEHHVAPPRGGWAPALESADRNGELAPVSDLATHRRGTDLDAAMQRHPSADRSGARWDVTAPSTGDPFAADNRPTAAGHVGMPDHPRPEVLTFGPSPRHGRS